MALTKGKEGFPTLGYQFHAGHNGEVFWLSHGFPGAMNDKSIVQHDRILAKLSSDPEYSDFEYEVETDLQAAPKMLKGLHSLCDGGYHKWLTAMCGSKHSDEVDIKAWSKLCESVRKDIECVFGILKKRFLILGGRFQNYEAAMINRAVYVRASCYTTCCLLTRSLLAMAARRTTGRHLAVTDEEAEVHEGWHEKRKSLIRHYAIALQKGKVSMLRTRAEIRQQRQDDDATT
eukprot:scaffold373300_cov18-Prasinocladus_malaysianus.AAC.1